MRKGILFVLVSLICILSSSSAGAESPWEPWHFNFGILPVGVMVAPDADGFRAWSNSRYDSRYDDHWEEVDGGLFYSLSFFGGVDYDTYDSGIGFDVFGNAIVSDALDGSIIGTNVSYIFPHSKKGYFSARVKAGIVYGSIDWEGDRRSVRFDDEMGWQAGLGCDFGIWRNMSFYTEALYRQLKFDVTSSEAYSNRRELDLSGVVFGMGVKFTY